MKDLRNLILSMSLTKYEKKAIKVEESKENVIKLLGP